jgi:hypothetical protein
VLEYTFGCKTYTVQIAAGSSDDVDVFRDGDSLFVVTSNSRLNYIGLEVFILKGDYAGEKIGDYFEQSPDDNEDLRDWSDRSTSFLARVMANYVEV